MKIIVGSGGHTSPGWTSTEIDTVDITRPLPYGPHSLEAIFASHVVEHVSSGQAMFFFSEAMRCLLPGGYLRIAIPVIGPWLTREHVIGLAMDHGHMCCYDEHILRTMLWATGFKHQKIQRVDFDPALDHHHLTIGRELDQLETLRVVATK